MIVHKVCPTFVQTLSAIAVETALLVVVANNIVVHLRKNKITTN